jgi:hypothetical protein
MIKKLQKTKTPRELPRGVFSNNPSAFSLQPKCLERQSQLVDQHVVVADPVCITGAFVIVTGEEITDAQHIGQVIGEFVSTGNVNFPTVLVADDT